VQVGEQIIKPSGWSNHPAVRMWRGQEHSLLCYAQQICLEWRRRGYNDSLLSQFDAAQSPGLRVVPPWCGDQKFHDSHKSNLIRKDPDHYGPMWPTVPANLPYIWPV
jgi:hypothetical protein